MGPGELNLAISHWHISFMTARVKSHYLRVGEIPKQAHGSQLDILEGLFSPYIAICRDVVGRVSLRGTTREQLAGDRKDA